MYTKIVCICSRKVLATTSLHNFPLSPHTTAFELPPLASLPLAPFIPSYPFSPTTAQGHAIAQWSPFTYLKGQNVIYTK